MLVHPQFDPVALSLGPVQIHWYGLTYLVAFGLFLWLAARRVRYPWLAQAGWTRRDVEDLLFYGVVGVVIGGRLGYVMFYQPDYFLAHPLAILRVWQGGMSFHGGLIGVVVAGLIYVRLRKIPLLPFADLTFTAAPIGLFLGRIANFINAELYGKVTDVPWAMVFPGAGPDPRHPSQLYEAGLEGIVLFLAVRFATHGLKCLPRPGFASGVFATGYALSRIIVEFAREPDAHIAYLTGGWLTMGMVLSLPLLAVGIWLIWRAGRVHGKAQA